MAHILNIRWSSVESLVTGASRGVIDSLARVEDMWEDMNALWVDAGGTDIKVAERLFGVVVGEATADQITMVADAKAAMQAMHELAGAMNNIVVAKSDRRSRMGKFL